MGNISLQEFITLISRYLDTEKLLKENPSLTKEMTDAFLLEISEIGKKGKRIDITAPENTTTYPRRKEYEELVIHTDGASRGNPGKAGIGVVIYDKDYRPLEELCRFIGESTNNAAEYRAMILAAQSAIAYRAKKVTFKTDSELLVRQLNGTYRVKSPGILPLYNELVAILQGIPVWKICHVRREENVHADTLANQGIDDSVRSER